ncbi:MAG: 2-oxoacid:ferredoxin oxidoreductase subunit gamma [Elusimicrobia bacterium CG06_land_8_20_14_3_00_38_11]|nr:MAG: 2-oxoacid:ferredoxin oxidoreductase subunit gamma [Elusimicrobia bacterium CG06_land_8_20_14_3_00_38_11]
MREEIIIAGSGGQGIMFLGNLLCNVAVSLNKYTTFYPSYGAEMRGGTANCAVIISDDEIGSPVIAEPSILIIMNEQSYNKYLPKWLKSQKGGLLFFNSSLIYSKSSGAIYVPATEIAVKLGDVRSANMVMLGKFIKETKFFSVASVNDIIKKVLENKKNLLEINLSAFTEGAKL